MNKIKAAIVGPGNIGIDLMYKLFESSCIELSTVIGIYPDSKGIQLAQEHGLKTSCSGMEEMLSDNEIKLVFDATSAAAHLANAEAYRRAGKIVIDMTPAMVGPFVVPAVNMEMNFAADNINMVTCGGQATIPMVAAINSAADVEYAEIVATIASKSAGPGTRANIDEFTETTARGICEIGGAERGKAIIVMNPAEPPIMMRDTVYARVKNQNYEAIEAAVKAMEKKVQEYVPGYRIKTGPLFDGDKVTVMLEVEGAGMYLPKYSGNLDIMTAAAKAAGEKVAMKLLSGQGE